VRGEVQFLGDGSGAEGEVVAVADVDGGTPETLRRSGPADGIASLDEQGAQTVPGKIRSTREAVVAGTDDNGVEVGSCRRHHGPIEPLR